MPYPLPTKAEAARFLSHATLGYTSADIEAVQRLGYEAWLSQQFVAWRQTSHWDWIKAKYPEINHGISGWPYPLVNSLWRRFIEGRDQVRQKTVFALTEIVVTSVKFYIYPWQQFMGAAYVDMLEANTFKGRYVPTSQELATKKYPGNYRNVLQGVSTSLLMAFYLTFKGSRKAGGYSPNSRPDENYARELLQLFTLGLFKYERNVVNGNPIYTLTQTPTYTQEHVTELARVFTGYEMESTGDLRYGGVIDYYKKPIKMYPAYFDAGSKNFDGLMPNIPASATGATTDAAAQQLDMALDGIFNHDNIGPNIAKRLIQRFVTSNPSPEYLGRVADVFNGYAGTPRGDLEAVIKAILLDPSLFDEQGRRVGGLDDDAFGKLREPVCRYAQLGRAFNLQSASGKWSVDTAANGLGQVPMMSDSVFNFFQPSYTPPNSGLAEQGLVSPEFQITNESSVISYINFVEAAVNQGIGNNADLKIDVTPWLSKVGNPSAMVEEMNLLLAAGQLTAETISLIGSLVNKLPFATTLQRELRIKAAVIAIMVSPQFLVQK